MFKLKTRSVLPAAALPLVLVLALQASAQEPKPAVAKPDPEVKAKLAEFKKCIKDRAGAKDADARKIVDDLLQRVDKLHPSDKKAFATALFEPLKNPGIKRKPEQANLYEVVIIGLGKTGEEGSKYLVQAFKKKKFKDKEWLSLRATMLVNLGMTKDAGQIGFLLDVALKDIHDPLMAAAGKALGEFADAPLKVRKDIAKDLIKKFINIHNNANANLDPGDLQRRAWEDRLKTVSDPWTATLQKLTKQRHRTPIEWERFYNKHKSDDWDKLK